MGLGEDLRSQREVIVARVVETTAGRMPQDLATSAAEIYGQAIELLIEGLAEELAACGGDIAPLGAGETGQPDPAERIGQRIASHHQGIARSLDDLLVVAKAARDAFHEAVASTHTDVETLVRDRASITHYFDRVERGILVRAEQTSSDAARDAAAEANRRLAGEKYRYLHAFRHLPVSVFVLDVNGLVEDLNTEAALLFDPGLATTVDRFTEPARRSAAPVLSAEVAEFQRSPDSERSLERELATGKGTRFFQVRLAKQHDRAGAHIGMLMILTDITHRRQAEQALRASQARYQALFENMNAPFLHVKVVPDERNRPADAFVVEVNPAYERMSGREAASVVGRLLSEWDPPADPAWRQWMPLAARVAMTGCPETFETEIPLMSARIAVAAYCPQPDHAVLMMTVLEDGRPDDQSPKQ